MFPRKEARLPATAPGNAQKGCRVLSPGRGAVAHGCKRTMACGRRGRRAGDAGRRLRGEPDSEPVWLAAVKLEWENDERERARALPPERRHGAVGRVWLKAALLERECEDFDAELQLLDEAITSYPSFHKFYLAWRRSL